MEILGFPNVSWTLAIAEEQPENTDPFLISVIGLEQETKRQLLTRVSCRDGACPTFCDLADCEFLFSVVITLY